MTDPLPKCKADKKGRHELNVILPDTVENPAVLFCGHCGITKAVALDLPEPLDDLDAADIARIVSDRG